MKICVGSSQFKQKGGINNVLSLYLDYFRSSNDINIVTHDFFWKNQHPQKFFEDINVDSTFSPYPFIYWHYKYWPLTIKKYIENYDVYQEIGGSFIGAEAFNYYKKPFYMWIGTTFEDEWNSVMKQTMNDNNLSFSSKMFRKLQNKMIPKIHASEKTLYNNSVLTFVQSNHTKNEIMEKFDIDKDKLPIIKSPLKTKTLDLIKEKNNPSIESKTFVTVSRLDPRKNLFEMIDIFNEFSNSKEYEDYKLKILGDGALKNDLINYINQNNLQNKIKIISGLTDEQLFTEVYNSSIYLSTALQEGFGLTILEGMYLKKPAIIYENGGSGEFVFHNKNGYIIPQNDKEQFIGKMKELTNSEIKYAQLSENAWDVAKEFRPEVSFGKMEKYYQIYM